jgi:cytochrome P450
VDNRTVVNFDQHSTEYKASFPEISHDIRSRCPAAWTERYGGYWVISGRELIGEMAKHPELLSNDHDPLGARNGYQGIAIPSPPGATSRGGFIEMDPPEQLEYRHALNPYLSPTAVERWRPMVRPSSATPVSMR